jgi:hypothetical protein
MDSEADFNARYRQLLIDYCKSAEFELGERWDLWPFKAADNCVHEVVGGLLARQTALATHLVGGPPMWTRTSLLSSCARWSTFGSPSAGS